MLRAALEQEQPAMLFADLDPPVCCGCCGRQRPDELVCAAPAVDAKKKAVTA